MPKEELRKNIKNLIDSKKEGTWWDFKEQYPQDNGTLVLDILCLGNNSANKNGLLIYGVQDNTFEIVGIKNDQKRKRQSDIIDLLKNGCCFENGLIPSITLDTIEIDGFELDVLSIEHYKEFPYRLMEDFPKGKNKIVLKWLTYTRFGDVNSSKDKGANSAEMKKLWGRIQGPEFAITFKSAINSENIFNYISPQKIAERNPLKRLSNSEYKKNPKAYWGEVDLKTITSHSYLGKIPGGIINDDNVTDKEMDEYNNALPLLEDVENYNKKQSFYENSKNNIQEFNIEIDNIGNMQANNVNLIISLPDGIFAYEKDELKDIKEPEPLCYPEHPVFAKGMSKLKGAIKVCQMPKTLLPQLQKPLSPNYAELIRTSPIPTREIKKELVIYDNKEIQIDIDNLLHSRYYSSRKFCIIPTKPGKYKIEYDIICTELETPQKGIFELTFEE